MPDALGQRDLRVDQAVAVHGKDRRVARQVERGVEHRRVFDRADRHRPPALPGSHPRKREG